jgi:hypothetical protein
MLNLSAVTSVRYSLWMFLVYCGIFMKPTGLASCWSSKYPQYIRSKWEARSDFVSCRDIVENSEITRADKTSDIFQEEDGGPYKASLPLLQATFQWQMLYWRMKWMERFKPNQSLTLLRYCISWSSDIDWIPWNLYIACMCVVPSAVKSGPWISSASDCSRCHWSTLCKVVRDHNCF